MPFDEDSNWLSFHIGTCQGYFGETNDTCEIFTISNTIKGNGDFKKTLKWFEDKCELNGKTLMFTYIEID